MAARPQIGRNPAKLKEQADRSKKQVAINRKEVAAAWMRQRDKVAAKLDKDLSQAAKIAKVLKELDEEDKRYKKLREDIEEILEGAVKEIKTISATKDMPLKEKMPAYTPNLDMVALIALLTAVMLLWKKIRDLK